MKIKVDLEIGIDTRNPRFARFFWSLLRDEFSELFPGMYGRDEPLSFQISNSSVDPLVEIGLENCYSIIWKPRDRPNVEGILDFTNGKRHSAVTIYGNPKQLSAPELQKVILRTASEVPVVVGFVHLICDAEFEATRPWNRQLYQPFNSGINPRELERYLPNLAWLTFFGRPYVDIMGADVLANTPAYWVEQVDDGYYVQLTEDIYDVANNYEAFDAVLEEAKAHIGRKFFFDKTGEVEQYVAPEFKYPEKWIPPT